MLVLDERHQIYVVLSSNDENALAAVTPGVRVLQNIEQVASLDVEDDFFEPDAALRPELRVLRVVPVEVLQRLKNTTTCARKAHVGIGLSVPKNVPERGPTTVIQQPTPTKRPIKNGPEIVNFRPVSVTSSSLSKPPPSASRPPHRASVSVLCASTCGSCKIFLARAISWVYRFEKPSPFF